MTSQSDPTLPVAANRPSRFWYSVNRPYTVKYYYQKGDDNGMLTRCKFMLQCVDVQKQTKLMTIEPQTSC